MKQNSRQKHRRLNVALSIILAVVMLAGAFYAYGHFITDNRLTESFYQLKSSKLNGNIRIVQLTDLHLKVFYPDNDPLVEAVTSLKPDLIVFTGDMMNYEDGDYSVVTKLIERLSECCPVIYSYGNNEYDQYLFKDSDITGKLEGAGATVLNNETAIIELNGSAIAVCGLSESPGAYDKYDVGRELIKSFVPFDGFKLLLDHYPEHYLKGQLNGEAIDLTLAGHTHGGQMILPVIGSVYTPDQDFKPELAHGDYTFGETTLIIGRGLGNTSAVPRFGNPPEIVVIDLLAL